LILDRPFTLSSLPYASHSFRLPSSLSSQLFQSSNPSQSSSPSAKSARSQASHTLTQAFLSILDLAIATIRHDDSYPQGPPSYNVILTTEHMHVIPRKEENARLGDTGDVLSVNSVGFAGYLLVKSEEELEAAKKQVSWTVILT
jgi:ATP adenylyltransferase